MHREAVFILVKFGGGFGITQHDVVQREAVVMVVAVTDNVGSRNPERACFHPHRAAERITAVADHQIGLEGAQHLGVFVEKVRFLFVRHLVPDSRVKAREEPVRDGVFGIGGTVLVDEHGLALILLNLLSQIRNARGTRRIVKHTAAETGGFDAAAGKLLQHRVDLHGGAVTHIENGLGAGKENT